MSKIKIHIYHQPGKLCEGNVFTCVCHSVQGMRFHVTITYDTLELAIQGAHSPTMASPVERTSQPSFPPPRHAKTCSNWTSLYSDPSPRKCSNLFTMEHVRLASGQLESCLNALLLYIITVDLVAIIKEIANCTKSWIAENYFGGSFMDVGPHRYKFSIKWSSCSLRNSHSYLHHQCSISLKNTISLKS